MINKRKRKNTLTPSVDKYALGDFVTGTANLNRGTANNVPPTNPTANSTLNGAKTLGSLGNTIAPGIGGIIGTGIGALGGFLFGNAAKDRQRRQHQRQIDAANTIQSNEINDLYESSLDMNNENPYGVYEFGGDIVDPTINIQRGELQIDPDSGKILREYTGINPETGGLYEPHNDSGEDTMNNLVTAKDGTFIVTTEMANKYKSAIDNNDKLYQNSILQNIRNRKRKLNQEQSDIPIEEFADGGRVQVNPLDLIDMSTSLRGGNLTNPNITAPTTLPENTLAPRQPGVMLPNPSIFDNIGQGLSDGLGFASGLYNIAQGSGTPNYQPYRNLRMNVGARQRILNEMPQEVSANPALNNVRGARNRVRNSIAANTSNPSIARANALSVEGDFLNAENEALFATQNQNNQIRSQRASILSSLDQQDNSRSAMNLARMDQTDEINRQLNMAGRQQVNTGVSQLIENVRNRNLIKDQKRNDRLRLQLLRDMNPYVGNYVDNWEQYLDR